MKNNKIETIKLIPDQIDLAWILELYSSLTDAGKADFVETSIHPDDQSTVRKHIIKMENDKKTTRREHYSIAIDMRPIYQSHPKIGKLLRGIEKLLHEAEDDEILKGSHFTHMFDEDVTHEYEMIDEDITREQSE